MLIAFELRQGLFWIFTNCQTYSRVHIHCENMKRNLRKVHAYANTYCINTILSRPIHNWLALDFPN